MITGECPFPHPLCLPFPRILSPRNLKLGSYYVHQQRAQWFGHEQPQISTLASSMVLGSPSLNLFKGRDGAYSTKAVLITALKVVSVAYGILDTREMDLRVPLFPQTKPLT